MRGILLYIGTFFIFLLVDAIWLGLVAKNLYQQQLGHLMADSVNWIAAILFYLLFVGGILVLAVIPAAAEQNLGKALLYGAIFGLICYATYDLTNLATIKDWPLKIVIIDMVWGTILSTLVSTGGYFMYKFLFIS